MILDLLPDLAKLFFLKKFKVNLSRIQAIILLGIGLQYKNLEILEVNLHLKDFR